GVRRALGALGARWAALLLAPDTGPARREQGRRGPAPHRLAARTLAPLRGARDLGLGHGSAPAGSPRTPGRGPLRQLRRGRLGEGPPLPRPRVEHRRERSAVAPPGGGAELVRGAARPRRPATVANPGRGQRYPQSLSVIVTVAVPG